MGVCMGVEIEDIEGKDTPRNMTDEKGTTDIVLDILDSEDSVINTLARKYNIDVSPFKLVPEDDDSEPLGPWQDPLPLWRAAHGIHQALDKDGKDLIGKEIDYREVDEGELDYWKSNLEDLIRSCKFAHERKKRVRFIVY